METSKTRKDAEHGCSRKYSDELRERATRMAVARCTVERLMRADGLRGVSRAKSPRTTRPAPETDRPRGLVNRQFTADAPNQLWVTGIALAALSLAIMPFLSAAQRRAGRELGSASTVADSRQTLLCTCLSAVLLAGLVLNATLGWSWAGPVAALAIAAVAVREGRDAWRGKGCCAPTAHAPAPAPVTTAAAEADTRGRGLGCGCCS
ncbi:hypothetical protein GCM10011583_73610 [Streptomyces camponoticapitis]|uniref:Transposase n=1 Tax=Streptomyces camponoticapitis TaxID=1616125 RepID=A0ABQ2F194_9ACTN|nr:hypothetical protein GCM10011583_73610 [Streptomyces camponoticapitis]